jgi:hypothetical protein
MRPLMRYLPSLLLAVVLTGCGPQIGPEEAVRQWLAEAQAAAEARDHDRLMDMVSPSYADPRGNDREDIERTLRLLFLRSQKILLVSKVEELTLLGGPSDASAAKALLTVGMAGKAGSTDSGILGLSADAYRFELELEKYDDGWQLIGARWGEVGQALR